MGEKKMFCLASFRGIRIYITRRRSMLLCFAAFSFLLMVFMQQVNTFNRLPNEPVLYNLMEESKHTAKHVKECTLGIYRNLYYPI